MADGTTDSGTITAATSARTIVDLYFRHVTSTVSNRDLWQVGDALLNDIDSVETRVTDNESSLITYELITDARLKKIETKVAQMERVVAEMIFDLNELGIDFSFKEIYNFRKQYLKK